MEQIKKFLEDFKSFALKGNLIDLAVAVIIGGAFGKVVDSFVKNLIMPLLSYITPGTGNYRTWHIGRVEIGAFLSEVINFLVVALALFLVLNKLLGTLERFAKLNQPAEPATKECPYCLSMIPARARKCAHCTADLAGADSRPAVGAPPTADAGRR